MAEESWTLVGLSESIGGSRSSDFWNLLYEVPGEHSSSGTYCVSIPKVLVENYAIEFGYDVNVQEGVDALFKHISYLGILTVKDREDGIDPTERMPAKVGVDKARESVHARISEIEQVMPVIQNSVTRMKMGLKMYGSESPEINTEIDLFEVIRLDADFEKSIPEMKRRVFERQKGIKEIGN